VQDRVLAVVMTVAFISLLFMTASATAEVFFATDFLEIGDIGYGALIASWTLGMALGATFVSRRVAGSMLAMGALIAIVVQGLGLAAPTLWLVPAFAFGLYVVGGLAHGTKNVLVRTLIHQRVPESLHGRAYAAYNALRNGAELVALVGGGLLVAALGARWTLFLAGAIPITVSADVPLRQGTAIASAQEAPTLGWVSPNYGTLEPAITLLARLAGSLPLRLETWWLFGQARPEELGVEWSAPGLGALPMAQVSWKGEELRLGDR